MLELYVNELLERRDDDCKVIDCERVLWINRENDQIITISIIEENALPKINSWEVVASDLEQGLLVKRDYDPYSSFMLPDEKLSEKEIQLRDRAWETIKDIVEMEPSIFDPSERYQMIKRITEETGKGKNLIYKYLRYYWKGGKTVNALLPRYRKCGGPGKRKNPTRKMGAPRITKSVNTEMEGALITEATRKIFDKVIRDVYLKVNRRDSVKFTYVQMLKNYFSIRTEMKGKVEIPIIPPEYKVPSIRQLRYYIDTKYSRKKRLISREGEVTFQRDFRSLLGSETRRATGPGQIFEIDATVADVYLVSSDNPNLIIGRPVVYIVVDVWSHMIAGFYIGLEGPSWQGVMMAIENTAANKVEICAQYDITIEPAEWPCCHLPECFYADRGEMESKHADSLGKSLGIRLKNAPPYRADLKGIVEQDFRTLNIALQPWMPGAVRKEYTKRGGPDYVLDAKLTLKDFTAMFIERVLYRNNSQYMEHYPLDKAQLRDNVKPIAREIWNWGLLHNHFLKKVHPDIVRLNVLPEKQVTASREGIYLEGMYFGCEELLQQGWFVKGKSIKTTIAYDRRCVNHIYVKTNDGRGFIKCDLLDKSSRFRNLSLEEVKELRYQEKLDREIYRSTELQDRVALEAKLEAIVNEAKQRSDELRDHSLTKTERKSGIKKNRTTERDKIRKEESFDIGISEKNSDPREENVALIDDYRPKSKLSLLANIRAMGGSSNG